MLLIGIPNPNVTPIPLPRAMFAYDFNDTHRWWMSCLDYSCVNLTLRLAALSSPSPAGYRCTDVNLSLSLSLSHPLCVHEEPHVSSAQRIILSQYFSSRTVYAHASQWEVIRRLWDCRWPSGLVYRCIQAQCLFYLAYFSIYLCIKYLINKIYTIILYSFVFPQGLTMLTSSPMFF